MKTAIYTLTSPLHDQKSVDAISSDFISEIESTLEDTFIFRGTDFSS